jgi:inhibitor of KinA
VRGKGVGVKIIPASDASLLVILGDTIAPEIQERVLTLFHALKAKRDHRILNLNPGYTSLLINFDPLAVTHEEVAGLVKWFELDDKRSSEPSSAIVEIPVCYEAEFGPDLPDVASHANLSIDEVIRLHSSATYLVCFLGFTAGFAYLGGMPQALQMARLPTPRRAVAAGSVGIAGGQTGIYPTETPGGWRLIGRTPVLMFDPERAQPTRVLPGDQLRFSPVDRRDFERLWRERR